MNLARNDNYLMKQENKTIEEIENDELFNKQVSNLAHSLVESFGALRIIAHIIENQIEYNNPKYYTEKIDEIISLGNLNKDEFITNRAKFICELEEDIGGSKLFQRQLYDAYFATGKLLGASRIIAQIIRNNPDFDIEKIDEMMSLVDLDWNEFIKKKTTELSKKTDSNMLFQYDEMMSLVNLDKDELIKKKDLGLYEKADVKILNEYYKRQKCKDRISKISKNGEYK